MKKASGTHGSWLRPLLLLTALCWGTYCLGLTTHGLTNWQEAQRALVAREMQARHEWVVPTVRGRPYLAKPPLMYWCQLVLADARGAETGEFELRLTVALAGWVGVMVTYVVARRMLGAAAAWWAGLFLATGFLYVRSARIGELDILLVPTTVMAIGGIFEAWRTHREENRTNFGAVAVTALGAVGAVMAKGPPGLLVIAIAGYGGMMVAEAWKLRSPRADFEGTGESGVRGGDAPQYVRAWIGGTCAALASGAAALLIGDPGSFGVADIAGVLILAGLGSLLGATLARLANRASVVSLFRAYAHTHPVAVLGVAALAFWGWGKMVEARIGSAAIATAIRTETADNLRVLVAESPINNLEAMVYGAGLGSIGALCAAVWWVRGRGGERGGTQRGAEERGEEKSGCAAMWVLVAWVVGGLIAFSMLGKGVPRYLTPLWPALAMVGGWWFAGVVRKVRSPRRLEVLMGAAVVLLGAGQSWWYGWERERLYADRSPRGMVAELRERGVDLSKLYAFEFGPLGTPAVDYYTGRATGELCDEVARRGVDPTGARTIGDLRNELARTGEAVTVLVRKRQPGDMDPAPAVERMRGAGLVVEEVPLKARYTIDNRKTEVEVVRVRAGAKAE